MRGSATNIRWTACTAFCLTTLSIASPTNGAAQDAPSAPAATLRDCPICPALVRIAPGSFERADDPNPWVRGDEERGSSHTVLLAEPFVIGATEVTVGQWAACVDAGGCAHTPSLPESARDDRPVVDVSWHDAQEYVRWLSNETGHRYRLPTEAEWEYAARAGTRGKFFQRDEPGALCAAANLAGTETDFDWASDLCRDAYPRTAPVGSFAPNGYGLHDVAGNVWEWVEDCFHDPEWESRGEWTSEYPTSRPTDGSAFIGTRAECMSRIMRGGSWRNGGAHVFSPQFRNFDYADRRYPNLGFRVARDAADPPDSLVVRPGDSAVQGERIREYEVVWAQYFETDGSRTLRRTIVDRVERESRPGGDLLVRSQMFLGLDGSPTSERVNHVDAATLAPLRERWRFRERVTHVDHDGVRVSGAMFGGDPGEPALIFDRRLSERGFDFNTAPLLLAAVALEPGLELRFPHVRISPPAFPAPEIAWATIRVEGREVVDAGSLGRVEAWRAVDPDHDMVFWLIPDPPYLVRVAFPVDASTLSVMELGGVLGGHDGR